MPTSLTEKHDSRKVTTAPNGDAQSAEFVYTLTGVADENSARILATNSTASTYGDLIRKSMLKMMRSPDESISVLLLQDIKDIFEQSFNDKMFSSDLVDKLKELSERPWSDWHKGKGLTTNGLAQQLKKFKVRSKGIRIEDTIKKGYCLDDFEYDFKRYLPDTPIQNVTPLQSNDISNLEQKQNGTEKNGVTFQKQDNQLNLFDCNGVTFQTGGEDEKKQIRYKNMPSHLHGHIDPKLAAEIYGTEE